MSITLGIYDLFSFVIPGLFYLYLLNDLLRVLGQPSVDLLKIYQGGQTIPEAAGFVLLVAALAFIIGHTMESLRALALEAPYAGARYRAMERIQERWGKLGIKIQFPPDQWAALLEILRQRNLEATQNAESYKASALMLRNISLGAFLYAVLQFSQLFIPTFAWQTLVLGLASLALSGLTFRQARRYDEWFYRTLFLQALAYGPTFKDFLENTSPAWHEPSEERETRETAKPRKR